MSERRISQQLRDLVSKRASYCCEYCGSQSKYFGPFSIEHIIPLSRGGTSDFSNLALACQHCNNYKYTKTQDIDPVTQVLVPLYNPRQGIWAEHFVWNESYSKVLGITATGRATVLSLRLNRVELINLRKALFQINEHPPKL
ncbi:MAG: HNH endonuclease signature motif containing protein [Phormidesmis sp.]